MHSAVAFSALSDSLDAACTAAGEALAQLPGHATLALVFATVQHDLAQVHVGLRQVLGSDTTLLVGGAVGVITNDHYGYAGSQLGLVLLHDVHSTLLAEGELDLDEFAAGQRLGARLSRLPHNQERAALLLYDAKSMRNGRGKLNMATPLLAGLADSCAMLPPLVGAGLIGDMGGSCMPQLVNDALCEQQAIALVLDGVRLDSVIMHGCQPASDYLQVTRSDGNLLYELEHRPALEIIGELLGHTVPPEHFGFFVTLGVNLGDKWGPYDETTYMNRMCLKADRKRQALLMFEPDLHPGTEVQLMVRNLDLDYIALRVDAQFAKLQGRRPVLALYINCAGRAAAYCGQEQEDAVVVQRAIAGRVPLLGFYSGVEIGQLLGRPMALDWTGVFCLLSVADEH